MSMRLKRLELLGFKSFADQTVFEFGDDTLTGIVGPNGCGKSNVVDAMRWVLGEQRAKSMRGKEMTDVIFKGCASRPGMGVAECTIVLDNSAGTVETHGAEISVTRRVYKSGEGEYRIDGQKVRLKDIKEMLFDTGLGSRGYSVLEQGRIDAVLSANAIDRRRIFEEAAGVSRYRQRKHETELRLARVHQDLERIDDVTGELRTRVRSLKIQAGKAERYVAAREEWEGKKLRLVKHQLHNLGGELEVCMAEIGALDEALSTKRTERESFEGVIEQLELERSGVADELHSMTETLTNLEGDARALDERRTQLLERVSSWEHVADEEAQRAVELDGQLAERSGELEVLEEQFTVLEGEAEGVRSEAQKRQAERAQLLEVWSEFRRGLEQQNAVVVKALNERSSAQNTLRHLENAQGPAALRMEHVAERLGAAIDQLGAVETEEEGMALEAESTAEALRKAESNREGLRGDLQKIEGELQEHESERARLELDIARRSSHIESLLDRNRELADLGEGAKSVLAASEGAEGPCAADELAGLIADHLQIGTGYARALDAVLGERSAALVLKDASAVRRVAQWMSEKANGQVALSVLGGLGSSRNQVSTTLPADIPAHLVVGRLRSEVQCDEDFAAVVDSLCGDVWLVQDLDAAMEVVRLAPSLRCVTPRGELVDAAGMIAGERTLAQGAIGRRSSAAELQGEVDALEGQLALAQSALARVQAAREALKVEMQRAVEQAEVCRRKAAEASGRLSTSKARVQDVRDTMQALEREHAGVEAERAKLAEDLIAAQARVMETEATYQEESALVEEMEAKRGRLEEEREELTRAEGESQVALTRVEEQMGGIERRMADLKRGIDFSTTEVQRAKRLAEEAGQSAVLGSSESTQLAMKTEALRTQRDQLAEEVSAMRTRAAASEAQLEEKRKERDAVTRLLEGRSGDLANMRLEEQRIGLAKDEVSRRAVEELELELEGLLEGFEPEEDLASKSAIGGLDKDVRELKSQLERMGPVNMEALGELEEVGGRLEFLESQVGDLTQARRVLNDTLKKIEEESERLFVKTFDEVRINFQRIFRQLFGGGKADVKLAEGEPVLEAGVEISARPPGREMLPIGLLSGGQRTMTALALLFAVFEARPSPFCVLDEVDAALDDANVQRFLLMLDQFRKSTQFVVVTHNKGTMARCEGLYGVTMQTKGVSRQVSVQLDEVDEFVPELQGKAKGNASKTSADPDALVLPDLDPNTGEPIKELVPASAGGGDAVHSNGTHAHSEESPA